MDKRKQEEDDSEVNPSKQSRGGAAEKCADEPATKGKAARKQRAFDWDKHNERHVALRIAYLGAKYAGFASQETTEETIEGHLFAALTRAHLIKDRASAGYSRCGRTDKGVSAFGQVISLNVRSKLSHGVGVIVKPAAPVAAENTEEIDYVRTLNRLLPEDIRAVAWAPVPREFDARFSCLYRTYKYYFPRGTMDIERMAAAAQHFVGEHDFRNFCKADIANNITNFTRRILYFTVEPVAGSAAGDPFALCELTVSGFAFLWHQVRCMVAILFLVGAGHEQPEIIPRLLDVVAHPRKPQYGLASELPLVLFDCGFEAVPWEYDEKALAELTRGLHDLWQRMACGAAVVRGMLGALDRFPMAAHPDQPARTWADLRDVASAREHREHRPLLARPTGELIEARLARKRLKDQQRVAAPGPGPGPAE
eukprot:m.41177 g.41177  ORF g.41177 m.41177 type:complete len:424 (+) comp10458_c0_seq1:43-1314(+)